MKIIRISLFCKIQTTDTSWDAWEKHLNAAIESWWNEKNRLGDSFFGNDGKGNNYTQLAWKGTKKCKCQNWKTAKYCQNYPFLEINNIFAVGIGAVASSKNWIFVVARYYPAGNVQGKFVENVPGWENSFDTDSGKSHSIKNHRMNNALPASTAVSNALNGHGLHTDDTSGFRTDLIIIRFYRLTSLSVISDISRKNIEPLKAKMLRSSFRNHKRFMIHIGAR